MKNNKDSKKIFGLFNIVDLLIIIVVIAVLIVGFKVMRKNSNNEFLGEEKKEIEYVINAQNISLESAQFVNVGDKVYKSENQNYLGVVTNVKYEEQVTTAFNPSTGAYEDYILPDKYMIDITIKGNGAETDENVVVEGTNVKIGTQLNVKGKGYVFVSYIVDIILD